MNKKRKKTMEMSVAARRSAKLLIAFLLGQAVQLIVHSVALNLWEYRQIPFCASAGFLVAVAVFMGIRIAVKEDGSGRDDMNYYD